MEARDRFVGSTLNERYKVNGRIRITSGSCRRLCERGAKIIMEKSQSARLEANNYRIFQWNLSWTWLRSGQFFLLSIPPHFSSSSSGCAIHSPRHSWICIGPVQKCVPSYSPNTDLSLFSHKRGMISSRTVWPPTSAANCDRLKTRCVINHWFEPKHLCGSFFSLYISARASNRVFCFRRSCAPRLVALRRAYSSVDLFHRSQFVAKRNSLSRECDTREHKPLRTNVINTFLPVALEQMWSLNGVTKPKIIIIQW